MKRFSPQGGPNIRGNLDPNKRQKRMASKAYENRFGIYRPATEETEAVLGEFAMNASLAGEDRLALMREVSAPLSPLEDGHGITIAPVKVIKTRLASAFQNGFELHSMVSRLEQHFIEKPLTLQIARIAWLGITPEMKKDRRNVVFEFAETEEREMLERQYSIIAQQLAKEGLFQIISDPKNMHMTVLKYGHSGDGMTIGKHHANSLIDLFEQEREDLQITSVSIDPITIGKTYHVPHPVLANHMEAITEIVDAAYDTSIE
jgi:hypothetical protein